MAGLSELEKVRLEKSERLRKAGQEPYPHQALRTHTTQEAIQAYEGADEEATIDAVVVGRLRSIRKMGIDGRLELIVRMYYSKRSNAEWACVAAAHLHTTGDVPAFFIFATTLSGGIYIPDDRYGQEPNDPPPRKRR